MVAFEKDAKKDILAIITKREGQIFKRLRAEKMNQKHLPVQLQDDSKIKGLEERLGNFQLTKQNSVVQVAIFDSDMIVVSCGRFLKYGFINETMFNDDIYSENEFTDINIEFGKNVEIIKIMNTSIVHRIQIIAKDLLSLVIVVATWDCTDNNECAMF